MKAFLTSAQSLEKHNGRDLSGMDLRDYFAAKALNGLINYSPEPEEHKLIAELCYQLADAMMKARENNE